MEQARLTRLSLLVLPVCLSVCVSTSGVAMALKGLGDTRKARESVLATPPDSSQPSLVT